MTVEKDMAAVEVIALFCDDKTEEIMLLADALENDLLDGCVQTKLIHEISILEEEESNQLLPYIKGEKNCASHTLIMTVLQRF